MSGRENITAWAPAIALGVAGAGSLLALPVIVSALAASPQSASATGSFAAVQSWSISAGCLASVAVGRLFPLRTLSMFALAGLLCADAATPAASALGALLPCRALAGLLGGLAMSLSAATLTRLPVPERSFGLSVLAQLLFAMSSTLVIPYAAARFGLRGAFFVLAAADLLALAVAARAMPRLPAARARADAREAASSGALAGWLGPGAVLLAIVCFYIGVGACWPNVGRIGTAAGLTDQETGRYLSLAAIGGVVGSFTPAYLLRRTGGVVAILVPAAALLAAMVIMAEFMSRPMFLVSAGLYYFGWYGLVPCLFGLLAAVDRDGRPSLASMGLVGVGIGIGSALAARASGVLPGLALGLVATLIAAAFALGVRTAPQARRN